jgi:hypothetical protein
MFVDLVALEAGCVQKPAPGKILGLNDTVFSLRPIGIIDPVDPSKQTKPSGGSSLPTSTLAGIVACVVVFIIAGAALGYIWYRKRKNKQARALAAEKARRIGGGGAGGGINNYHRPQSSLSFQCQTHMSPRSPKFFPGDESPVGDDDFKPSGSPQLSRKSTTMWSASDTISTVAPSTISQQTLPGGGGRIVSQQSNSRLFSNLNGLALHSLDTTAKAPARFSPYDDFGHGGAYTTPTSTTSTRSTAALLPRVAPYVPADYALTGGFSPPQQQGAWPGWSPASSGTGSPQQARQSVSAAPTSWASPSPPPPPPPSKSPRMTFTGLKKGGGKEKEKGSPIETKVVDTVFPPPPTRR